MEEFETPKDRFIKFGLLIVGVITMSIISAHGDHSHEAHIHSHSH